MQVQADALFRGILRGLYDFGTAPATPFRDEAANSVEEQFGADLLNWRKRLPSHATRPRLDAFLARFCPEWADRSSAPEDALRRDCQIAAQRCTGRGQIAARDQLQLVADTVS
jgi:hypothetical protein